MTEGNELRWWRWVACGAMAFMWSVCAEAGQSPVVVQSPTVVQGTSDGIERHGWAVLPMGDGFVLVHLPPRTEVVGSDGFSARADDGEMAIVRELSEAPERVVSSSRTVFLIFEPRSDRGKVPMRSVLSVLARPTPMGGRWSTDSKGRMTGRAGFAGSRAIIDAVGFRFAGRNEDQCAVLLTGADEVGEAGQSILELLVLDGNAWASVALPAGLEATDLTRLVVSGRDLVLMARARDGSGWLRWRGVVTPGATTFPEPTEGPDEGLLPVRSLPMVQWAAADLLAGFSVENDAFILEIDGTIVTSRLGPTGRWVVRAARDGAMAEVLSRELRGRAMALVVTGVESSARLVLLEKDPEEDIGGVDASEGEESDAQELRGGSSGRMLGLRLVEVSVATGRVLFEGPAHLTPLISLNEYQLLVLMVIATVVGVLVFVLLPNRDDGVVTLPDGTALAEPFRRVAAGAMDVAFALLLASWILGLASDSGRIEHTTGDLWTLVLTMVFAYTHGVLGEWAMGRTAGKVLLGCKVVGTRKPGSSRVGLTQALVRNLVKYAMPPVAVFGLSDANGRHRGDVLAGTVVVIWVDDEGHNGSEAEPDGESINRSEEVGGNGESDEG